MKVVLSMKSIKKQKGVICEKLEINGKIQEYFVNEAVESISVLLKNRFKEESQSSKDSKETK